MIRSFVLTVAAGVVFAAPALANPDDFGPGPLIEAYGPIAPVENDMPIPEGTEFNVLFDTARGAEAGELNRTLTSAARFLNMHVAAGVPAEQLNLAIVIHGGAVRDVSDAEIYSAEHGDVDNPNAGLIAALREHGVEIYVCGQSAAYYGVENENLLPGVTMALSAMTANAMLQQQGYTLNPF